MPSQLSTSTSKASSNSCSVQLNKTGGQTPDKNGVQVAPRSFGNSLTHSSNKIDDMGTTLEEVSKMADKLCNGDSSTTDGKVTSHNGHSLSELCNGVPAMALSTRIPKTEGFHSNEGSTLTGHCDEGRLICPRDAVHQTDELVASRVAELSERQKELALRFASLERSIEEKQMKLISQHLSCQITNSEESRGGEEAEGSGFNETVVRQWSFPIQVDGASDDTFLSLSLSEMEVVHDDVDMEGVVNANLPPTKNRCEESFSSIDSLASIGSVSNSYLDSEGDTPSKRRSENVLKAHATSISALLDDDLTESSSDEEESAAREPVEQSQRSFLKHSWDVSRMMVGSRWLWLQRKIAELNKQIYLLDHHVKGLYQQDHCKFGSSSSSSSVLSHSSYFPFTNGSTLEKKLRAMGNVLGSSATGSTHPLLPLAKVAALTSKHISGVSNGFTTPPTSSQSSLPYLPHLFLPEALLAGGRLQVKELLSPSPLGQNLLCLDEGTSARTRPLLKRSGRRKVVRRRRVSGHVKGVSLDPSRHSHLSMPHELPSRVLLDSVMRDALTDHSYARLPLGKRHRAASSLPFLVTPTLTMESILSTSPSPNHTPCSLESSKGPVRKKVCPLQQQTSYESVSTVSTLGNNGSPWSPGISRPPTPSLTPQSASARKKKVTHSTPLFDIDNIVIPYSIASSTRLEKLEYKEIITPRWRAVDSMGETPDQNCETSSECRAGSEPVVEEEEEEEDLTDEVFSKRHNRSELNEKKRFLNFISGSNHRRRVRPHSVTLSESPSCAATTDGNLTSPPLRRVTVTSPIPLEIETRHLPEVLPWQPRKFPLSTEDEDALHNPPPPPPPTFLSSPIKHLHTSTPSRSPSCTTSAYNTPLGSPPSTPIDDTPTCSPAEWVVNSHFNTAASSTGHSLPGLHQLPTVLTSSQPHLLPQQHQPIILKLTKKT